MKSKSDCVHTTCQLAQGTFGQAGKSLILSALLLMLFGTFTNKVIADSATRNVTLGSTEEQLQDALKLCRSYSEICELSWYEDEAIRSETLSPYRLDSREVTVGEFASYINSSGKKTQAEVRGESTITDINDPMAGYYSNDTFWHNAYPDDNPLYPVVHVTQLDASGYCASVGKRLPSEAEWEYAARGEQRQSFPWGNDWPDSVSFRGNTLPQGEVFETASHSPTAAGYYDLSGSVAEWTTTIDTVHEAVVVKGGSRFSRNVANLRAAVRRLNERDYSGDDVGFRCAESLTGWPHESATILVAKVEPAQVTLEPETIDNSKSEPVLETETDIIEPTEVTYQTETKTSPEKTIDTPTNENASTPLAVEASREEKLKVNSFVSSATKLIELGKFEMATNELDQADAINQSIANTQPLREKIQLALRESAKSTLVKAPEAPVETATVTEIAEIMDNTELAETEQQTDTAAQVDDQQAATSAVINDLLLRGKVLRKTREIKHNAFNAYIETELPDSIDNLFTFPPKENN